MIAHYLALNMFSPDELLNSGSSLVYYYGYDIYGEKLGQTHNTLKSFFEGNVIKKYSTLSILFIKQDIYKINLLLKI